MSLEAVSVYVICKYTSHMKFGALGLSHVEVFLGISAKLQRVTTSFIISVCLSVCLHGTTRIKIDILS